MKIPVGVINVPTSVGARAWAACFRAIAGRAGVFGINEVFSRRAKALFIALATALGYAQYGARTSPNPVFWRRRDWRRVSGRVVQLHGALSQFREWPGFNGARYVTEVVLRRRGRRHHRFPQVVILCTHWVPDGPKVTAADRDRARATSKRAIRALILEHLAAGRIVYLIGDTNVHGRLDLDIPGLLWLRGDGVDKVAVILPAGYFLFDHNADEFAAPTDHKHGVATTAHVRTKPSKEHR